MKDVSFDPCRTAAKTLDGPHFCFPARAYVGGVQGYAFPTGPSAALVVMTA